MISWVMASSSAPSVPGRMGTHSSAMAEYPVRTGLMETKRPPFLLNFARAILRGLEWWSSAVPIITKSFARSRSGPPNSQKEPPMV